MFCLLALVCMSAYSVNTYGPMEMKQQEIEENPLLLEILSKLNIKHDKTLESIVRATQREFLRKAGTERWEIEENDNDKLLNVLLPLFKDLGMIAEKNPTKKKYKYVVILGSTFESMLKRLKFLERKAEEGLEFSQLLMLGGQRKLTTIEKEELARHGYPGIDDERDMLKIAVKMASPGSIKVPFQFITCKAAPGAHRATTEDTVAEWLKTNPEPGAVLVISSYPHVHYQEAVLRRLLPETFSIEGIGNEARPGLVLGVYTDALARFLYECFKARKKLSEKQNMKTVDIQ